MLVRVVARPVDLFLAVRLNIHRVTCSAMTGMLMALGARLQRLTMHVRKGAREHNTMSGLAPAVLRHCPLLAHVALENIGPSTLAEVGLHANCCVTTELATFTYKLQDRACQSKCSCAAGVRARPCVYLGCRSQLVRS